MSINGAIAGFYEGLRPVKRLTVDQWSDENVRLTSENSAEPGRYRTDRFPFNREIMQCLSPSSHVTDIIYGKGVQVGATTIALNMVGCYVDIDPCPIMYVMPTIALAEAVSKDRFTPMVENSPALSAKIKPARERDSGNTVLVKSGAGFRVIFSGANSAASLRSRPVRVLAADEVDAFPFDVDGEGSPLSLAEKRQSTFGAKRKTFKLSTPTIKGASVIEFELELTDYRKYFVPCPHCGSVQHLQFDQLRRDQDNHEDVWYECEHCHEVIEERHKPFMLSNGEWIATKPENAHPTRRGYHLNSLYSPLGMLSWVDIYKQYDKALGDASLMKTFVNSILGETYEEAGDAPEWERLFSRRKEIAAGTVPDEAVFLTAGADVQRDRIEVEVVAWMPGKKSHSIDYRVLEGDTSARPVWDRLSAMLSERWQRPDGAQMPVRMLAVDSGFNTTHAYAFCQRHDAMRVVPVKGDDDAKVIIGTPKSVEVSQSGKKIGAVRLWNVGVSILKTELYGWLRLDPYDDGTLPDGYCTFPEYSPHYFKMLTAEKLQIVRDKKGFLKQAWVLPSHARNEALDCRVYARAAAAIVGMDRFAATDWAEVAASYAVQKKIERPKPRVASSFWDGRGSIWEDGR